MQAKKENRRNRYQLLALSFEQVSKVTFQAKRPWTLKSAGSISLAKDIFVRLQPKRNGSVRTTNVANSKAREFLRFVRSKSMKLIV